jgi:uncharacterized damage-inducible protein DinB
MTDLSAVARESMIRALSGYYAHMDVRKSLEGVEARMAGGRPPGAPHSIHQIVNHMIFWQDFFLERLAGTPVPEPDEDRWPWAAEPESAQEWQRVVATFFAGLDRAVEFARAADLGALVAGSQDTTRLEALRTIASHNSYHAGQIVLLRQLILAGGT